MRFGVSVDCSLPDERANYRYLVQDITWFGLAFAATSRFLSVYAIRLGATPLELGLISSLPAIILLFSSALGGWWLAHSRTPQQALLLPGLGHRLLFLLPAFAPFLPESWQPAWLIFSVAVPAIPQGIASIAFMVLMRQAVHDRLMPSLLSHRQMALNIGIGIAALAFGLWLEQAPFPLNYQVMFVVAFLFALMSERACLKIRAIVPAHDPAPQATTPPQTSPWRSQRFLRVAAVVLASHIAFTSIVPVTPLRLIDDLSANEGFLALFGLAELVAGATITLFTSRIVARIGNQAMIAAAMIGTALAALLIALAPSLPLTLVAAALSGASWTAVGVGIYGFFTENTPPQSMTSYSIAYQQVIGLGLFIGPMIGSTLANSGTPLVLVVLAGAGLRLAAGAFIEHGIFARIGRSRRLRPAMKGVK